MWGGIKRLCIQKHFEMGNCWQMENIGRKIRWSQRQMYKWIDNKNILFNLGGHLPVCQALSEKIKSVPPETETLKELRDVAAILQNCF